ncbi:MATE family efflux transporter [Haloimpatiens sp. FM7330]|uniref:MATE family efflux transporter n=1 Tax=Haloimpatiens sp. FM7330 TaxID=3298610 RepID=UPI00363F6227
MKDKLSIGEFARLRNVTTETLRYYDRIGLLKPIKVDSKTGGPILSYNYGYKKYDRLKDTLKLSSKVNITIGVVLFFILFTFGKQLVSLFVSGNESVINLAVEESKIYAFAFFVCGFNIIRSGYFTAIGDARGSIIIAASRGIVFIILGISILPMIIGMSGVWVTVPFAECMTFIIGMYLVKKKL